MIFRLRRGEKCEGYLFVPFCVSPSQIPQGGQPAYSNHAFAGERRRWIKNGIFSCFCVCGAYWYKEMNKEWNEVFMRAKAFVLLGAVSHAISCMSLNEFFRSSVPNRRRSCHLDHIFWSYVTLLNWLLVLCALELVVISISTEDDRFNWLVLFNLRVCIINFIQNISTRKQINY